MLFLPPFTGEVPSDSEAEGAPIDARSARHFPRKRGKKAIVQTSMLTPRPARGCRRKGHLAGRADEELC
jgi:hypothetical protein